MESDADGRRGGQAILPRIVFISVSENARRVCVRALPSAPALRPIAAIAISSCASAITITSYRPRVQNISFTVTPCTLGSDLLSEIPRFHLDLADVAIGVIDIAGPQAPRRGFARIRPMAVVPHLIAAAVRQGKGDVALADARKLRRQIGKILRDEMDHLAFALDAAVHRDHAGR